MLSSCRHLENLKFTTLSIYVYHLHTLNLQEHAKNKHKKERDGYMFNTISNVRSQVLTIRKRLTTLQIYIAVKKDTLVGN